MRILVLQDRLPEQGASPDQTDVLVQAATVVGALRDLGHDPLTLSATLDLRSLKEQLGGIRPDLVFNLVESLGGCGRLIHLAPALLDCMGVPYTGSGTDAVFRTSGKLLTKRALRQAGIPTPRYFSSRDLEGVCLFDPGPYIIKSVWEHASLGLGEESVVTVSEPPQLLHEMRRREAALGGECFAEAYIEGREFNLSLLAAKAGPDSLPPAEIQFVDFPGGKKKVVGYQAKWHETSFEYLHTVRSFEFPPEDGALLRRLAEMATRCWSLFDLRGYARVDFRVDRDLQPWVLEINVNPCLAPKAGFLAAAARAGLSPVQVVDRIVQACEGPAADRAGAQGPPEGEKDRF